PSSWVDGFGCSGRVIPTLSPSGGVFMSWTGAVRAGGPSPLSAEGADSAHTTQIRRSDMPNRLPPATPEGEPLTPEATIDLVELIKRGDEAALQRLFQRCIPTLRRWARGRLPQSVRGMQETSDIVQDVVLAAIRKLEKFEVRHQGALQAYLRQAVINRIRD